MHPAARILSAYRNRIKGGASGAHTRLAKHIAKRMRQKASTSRPTNISLGEYENIPTFSEFLEADLIGIGRNIHWKPASTPIRACDIGYNFIGHKVTARDLGCLLGPRNLSLWFPLPHKNGAVNIQEYFTQVPTSVIRGFEKRFKKDYEIFGYESILDDKTGELKNFTDECSLERITTNTSHE